MRDFEINNDKISNKSHQKDRLCMGQGPTTLAVGAVEVVWTLFSLRYPFSLRSPSLLETARYRLKYCLKGPLSPKQPTNNQPLSSYAQ